MGSFFIETFGITFILSTYIKAKIQTHIHAICSINKFTTTSAQIQKFINVRSLLGMLL